MFENEAPRISIVILNAFSTKYLKECLSSLLKTNYPNFEIVIVDCLTPNIEDIKNDFDSVQVISLKKDVGPSEMHNIALSSLNHQTKYVAFLDNDVEVEPDWLNQLVSCLEKDVNAGAAQAKVKMYYQENLLNSGGCKANYLMVGWCDRLGTVDNDQDSYIQEIIYPSGCAMVLRISALEKINFFDGDLFIEGDDLDLGLRLRYAGYKTLYCPKSIVFHKYKYNSKRGAFFVNRNRIQTFLKLYQAKTYLFLIPPIFVYEFSVFTFATSKGHIKQIINAYIYTVKNIVSLINKRNQVKKYKAVTDKNFIENLEGPIFFQNMGNRFIVRACLNPFLKYYRKALIKVLKW